MSIRKGYETVIKISGGSTNFTAQNANDSGDHMLYTMAQTAVRAFDPDGVFTVYDGGVETTEDYEIDYIQGGVRFATADTRTITIAGACLTMSTVATASSLSVNESSDLLDITPFNGVGYRKRKAGLKSASGTITEFDVADETFTDAIISAEFLILDIYEVSHALPKRYWAVFESSELQAAVEGAQTQVLSWQSHKEYDRLIS
jgi:hypothetical protein